MATGIVKGERVGDDAITADIFAEEPYKLPDSDSVLTLSYQHKISDSEILAPVHRPLVTFAAKRKPSRAAAIDANAFIVADNFFGMHALLGKFAGKVSLIYTDPPFATGMEFHSRQLEHAYGDKFGEAAYIEFMRRRLVLMRELLGSDGSLYLHIGHQMLFHLKVVLDEVFGRQNFRNLIVRKKCSSKNYTRNQYANLNDYILFYTKSKTYKWNQPGQIPSEDWIQKEYPKIDERGRYKLVPIHAPGTRKGETGMPWKGRMPPKGKHWQYTPSKLDELDRRGEIYYSKNDNPRRKVYLPKDKSLPLTDYWDTYRDAHHQSIEITGYPTEKNLEMVKMIIGASTNVGDLVVDPFVGSGTTLHAAHDLDRDWFGIDESLTAANAAVHRLRHGLAPMGDFVEKTPSAPVVDLFDRQEKEVARPIGKITRTVKAKFDVLVDEQLYKQHEKEVRDLASI